MRKSAILILLITLLLIAVPASQTTFAQGDGEYSVDIDPANFVDVVDNPYFPRLPGMRWVYEGQTEDGEVEHVEIEVLSDTREVMGVQVTIMRDTVSVDGEVVEDTYDWFAQDVDGNVWYFGEEVSDFEDGELVSNAGSWEAGVDGALPGIVMYGDPEAHARMPYYQEYYPGEAEDSAILLNTTAQVTVPAGEFEDVVLTYDWNPLEDESHEIKYFAPGVGEVKSIDLITGEIVELIEYSAS